MVLVPHFVQNELDASDNDLDERLSAFNFCNPFDHVLPFADGTIGSTDRAHLWGLFSGIAVAAPADDQATAARRTIAVPTRDSSADVPDARCVLTVPDPGRVTIV